MRCAEWHARVNSTEKISHCALTPFPPLHECRSAECRRRCALEVTTVTGCAARGVDFRATRGLLLSKADSGARCRRHGVRSGNYAQRRVGDDQQTYAVIDNTDSEATSHPSPRIAW